MSLAVCQTILASISSPDSSGKFAPSHYTHLAGSRRSCDILALGCDLSERSHNNPVAGCVVVPLTPPGRPMENLAHIKDPEQLREAFHRYLKSHGIKNTKARDKVFSAVLELDDHFEAEQVLYLLKERNQKVGKATIYRTLPLLVDCGILRQVRFDVKQAHYEHAFGENPHDHMVCRRCGRIVEFAMDEVVALGRQIARRHHFHVISHRFQLSGLCWVCSTKCPVATLSPPDENDKG